MKRCFAILATVVLLFPYSALAAGITFDTASKITTDGSGTSLTSNTFTINSGDTLAVFEVYFGNAGIAGTQTFTCTVGTTIFVGENVNVTSLNNIFIYYINNPTVGTGTCTQSTTVPGTFLGQLMSLYKGSQVAPAPFDTAASTTCTAASTCTLSMSGFGSNDWVTVQGASNNNPPGPSTGLTSRIVDQNGWSMLDSNGAVAGSGSFTATSSSNSIIQLVGESWIPAATAASPTTLKRILSWF